MRDKRGWLRCDWCGMPIPGDWEDCGDEVEECAHCFHERLVATVEAQAALLEELTHRCEALHEYLEDMDERRYHAERELHDLAHEASVERLQRECGP